MSLRLFKRRLRRDQQGATIVEFGFIAPIFLMMLMAIFELGHTMLLQATLHGALQQAGRNTSLESGLARFAAIDDDVEAMIKTSTPDAEVSFDRKNYYTFSDVGQPEDFVDSNGNGVYDADECFTDMNNNQQWDSDVGRDGIGGADDVVSYTVTVEYQRMFPVWGFLGWNQTGSLSSTTLLRNQPYGSQVDRVGRQICRAS